MAMFVSTSRNSWQRIRPGPAKGSAGRRGRGVEAGSKGSVSSPPVLGFLSGLVIRAEHRCDVVKTAWANAIISKDLISVRTYSGYRSSRADPQGVEHFLSPDAADKELGSAVLDALAHSRFVLPESRKDDCIHPEATFDKDLYNYNLTNQRYDQWVSSLLERYGYKTKRALFKDMKNCSIESKSGQITIRPSHHEKLEAWSGEGISASDYVTIPGDSSPSDVGAALRLAFSRCT